MQKQGGTFMSKIDTSWYELIGREGTTPNQLVKSETYASAVSVSELGEVALECPVPFQSMAWEIFDRSGNTVLNGEHSFPDGGTNGFLLKDAIPLTQLKPYETVNADYGIHVSVVLASGDTVSGAFAFKCSLHAGESTTQFPGGDLAQQLANIPIANARMTEDQVRQICLDYMRLETEFPFKFEDDFVYIIQSQKRSRRLLGGKIYGGIPYVSRGAGNLYRIAEVYDPETGVLDVNSDIFDDIRYFGNACSGAASMAWARAVTSAYLGYTMFMTEANGFLPVGPYRYPKENVTKFDRNAPNGVCCRSICTFNGENTMLESYAQLKPADGAVCDGHVRMNSAHPTVVRKEDGTIDPDRSYTLMREQVCYISHPNHIRIAPDGTHYPAQGFVDVRYSFRDLFEKGYIPFTFAEFADPSRIEPARLRLAVEPELRERVLTANYPISDVFVERNGKRYTFRNMEFFRKEVKMSDIFPQEALAKDSKITVRLYNGELLDVVQ